MAYSELVVGAVSSASGHRPTESHRSSSRTANKDKEFQFPAKLYEMLEIVDSLGLSDVVTWLPNGRSFQVKDPTKFMELVVPRFFKATKYRSFQRQLNLWGFIRVVKGQGNGVWYHESFIRGSPEMISKLTRTRIKGQKMPVTQDKSKEAHNKSKEAHNFHLVQTSEVVTGYTEEDTEYACENSSYVSDDTREISNRSSPDVLAYFEGDDTKIDEDFSTVFSERAPGQCVDDVGINHMYLEPLPVYSAGILDGNRCNSELAEFGQLLGALM
mmetsp:Transcript_21724/g.32889  ORF Transcript_21724/g.32889 Transcript_21724/m.32889 type:complete len:271 (-) Transcript_21724:82-894(-)